MGHPVPDTVAGAMGNRQSSNVPDDVRRQPECQTPVSKFVDLGGGGDLIALMKTATKTKDYSQVAYTAVNVRISADIFGNVFEGKLSTVPVLTLSGDPFTPKFNMAPENRK